MSELNIKDYGAVGDGETDDTDAINQALSEASPGDTVLIPKTEDSYLVSSESRAAVNLHLAGPEVTVTGEGPNSVIKMASQLDSSSDMNRWIMGIEANTDQNLTNLEIKKLVLDGNKSEQPDFNQFVVAGFSTYPSGSGHDVLLEDIIAQNCPAYGIKTSSSRIRLRRITCRNNDRHGFGPGAAGTGSKDQPGCIAESIKVVDNGRDGNGTGLDVTSGYIELRDLYVNNSEQGNKIGSTGGQPDYLKIENSNFKNSKINSGWRLTGGNESLEGVELEFDNVQFINSHFSGFLAQGGGTYNIGTLHIENSNLSNNDGSTGISIQDESEFNADELRVINTNGGPGMNVWASASGNIEKYCHFNNDGGAVNGDISIGEMVNTEKQRLEVPGPDDVGAFSAAEAGTNSNSSSGVPEYEIPSDAVDIRNHGAKVDGETDDTGAIMNAINEAGNGGAVFIPEGTTVVSADGGDAVELTSQNAQDLTIIGKGKNSVIKMEGNRPANKNQWLIGIEGDSGEIKGLEIKNLTIDGNRQNQSQFNVLGLNLYPGGTGHDILVKNVLARNCSESGFSVYGGYVRFEDCTARNNGRQGFAVKPVAETQEPDVECISIIAEDNDKVGIDHNDGSARFEKFWSENNVNGGAKVPSGAKESWWIDGTFKDNRLPGFRWNGDIEDQIYNPIPIHLDNVNSVGSQYAGFRFSGNVKYDIGTIRAANNNKGDNQRGNIDIVQQGDVNAKKIISCSAANGFGIHNRGEIPANINNFIHSGNEAGAIDDTTSINIRNQESGNCENIDVPEKDDLGAWSSTGTSGENDQEKRENSSEEITAVRQGEIEKLNDNAKSAVFGNTATGVIEEDSDRYRITGRVSEFHVEEPVNIRVNGEPMSGQEFIQRFVKCVPKSSTRIMKTETDTQEQETGSNISDTGIYSELDKAGPKSSNEIPEGNRKYVSPDGDDSNPGTEERPWKSMKKVAKSVEPGDVVLFRGGTYQLESRLVLSRDPIRRYLLDGEFSATGTEQEPITLMNYPGEEPVLDGQNLSFDWGGLIFLTSVEHITINGLNLKNSSHAGIFALHSKDIEVKNCVTNNTYSSGIISTVQFGDVVRRPENITIKHNDVRRACNGSEGTPSPDEHITVAKTSNFEISHNIVHRPADRHTKEGIDAKSGVKDGVIAFNKVRNMDRLGIYVDTGATGAENISIYGNEVKNCLHGIVTSSEEGGSMKGIKIFKNILYKNDYDGIWITTFREDGIEDVFDLKNIYAYNNTCFKNGRSGIHLEDEYSEELIFKNNILSENNQNQFINKKESAEFQNNLEYGPGADGSAAFNTEPMLVNPSNGNFRLEPESPCVDSGSSDLKAIEITEIFEIIGAGIDIGAVELR